jgi:hypothetical protein
MGFVPSKQSLAPRFLGQGYMAREAYVYVLSECDHQGQRTAAIQAPQP